MELTLLAALSAVPVRHQRHHSQLPSHLKPFGTLAFSGVVLGM
jgi:hypothetical protein